MKGWFVAPKFGNKPRNLNISWPRTIRNPQRIFFGENVHLGPNSVLKAITSTGALMKHPENLHVEQTFQPKIVFGDRVSATGGLHVAAHSKITIEDDVMLASNVFLADALHGYDRIDIPFKYQGMIRIAPITIKQGCWIGQNVVVMPGITIGKMSVVGANSVVTKDIPSRSIAVGSPARVIKRWCERGEKWVSVGTEPVLEEQKNGDSSLSERAAG